jgi:hypothetical protein
VNPGSGRAPRLRGPKQCRGAASLSTSGSRFATLASIVQMRSFDIDELVQLQVGDFGDAKAAATWEADDDQVAVRKSDEGVQGANECLRWADDGEVVYRHQSPRFREGFGQ